MSKQFECNLIELAIYDKNTGKVTPISGDTLKVEFASANASAAYLGESLPFEMPSQVTLTFLGVRSRCRWFGVLHTNFGCRRRRV